MEEYKELLSAFEHSFCGRANPPEKNSGGSRASDGDLKFFWKTEETHLSLDIDPVKKKSDPPAVKLPVLSVYNNDGEIVLRIATRHESLPKVEEAIACANALAAGRNRTLKEYDTILDTALLKKEPK